MVSDPGKIKHFVDIAKKRIPNILRTRLVCSIRQLEAKISEAGPFNQRVDPHHISTALRQLQDDNVVISSKWEGTKYYYLKEPTASADVLKARVERIHAAHNCLIQVTKHKELCGDALENIVNSAISEAGNYTRIDASGPMQKFGNIELPGALDSLQIVHIPPGYLLAVEAKNIREWIYGQSVEIWQFLRKAAILSKAHRHVQPIFVARKIQYETILFFQRIGVIGFETRRQYFDPSTKEKLADVRDKDGLGYHDICFDTDPPDHLIEFFREVIPKYIVDNSSLFHEQVESITNHMEDLASEETHGGRRTALWHNFLKSERIFYPKKEDDDYFEPDYNEFY